MISLNYNSTFPTKYEFLFIKGCVYMDFMVKLLVKYSVKRYTFLKIVVKKIKTMSERTLTAYPQINRTW